MKKVNLKKALSLLGYEVVQYHKNYNFRSGFMMKDGQLYYFNYEDLRWSPTLLIRTADPTIKNKKGEYADYRGGTNTYPEDMLSRLGYKINEPRQSCDFNAN
jgi:hypothetical protein